MTRDYAILAFCLFDTQVVLSSINLLFTQSNCAKVNQHALQLTSLTLMPALLGIVMSKIVSSGEFNPSVAARDPSG